MTNPNFRLTMNMFLPDGMDPNAVVRFFVEVADALERLKPTGDLEVMSRPTTAHFEYRTLVALFAFEQTAKTAPVGAQPPDPPSPQPEKGLGVSDTCQASQNRQRDAMWRVPDEPLNPVSREDRNQIAERQHFFYEVDR